MGQFLQWYADSLCSGRMGRQISECSETSVTSTDTPSTEKRLQDTASSWNFYKVEPCRTASDLLWWNAVWLHFWIPGCSFQIQPFSDIVTMRTKRLSGSHLHGIQKIIEGMKAVWRTPHSSLADVGQTASRPKVPNPRSSATSINTDHHIISLLISTRGFIPRSRILPVLSSSWRGDTLGCASLGQIAIRNKPGWVRNGGEAL